MTTVTKGYARGMPEPEWWMRQIREGINFRKQEARQSEWSRWRDFYRGKWPRDVLAVNTYFRMLRQMIPQIYFRNPGLSISAAKPGFEQQAFAQLIERIDNKLIKTMNVKDSMRMGSQTSWMYGTGFVKLGYGAQFTPTPEMFDTSAPEEFRTKLTRKVEYNSQVRPNMPWLMDIHPRGMIVPKGLVNFRDTPWVAHWMQRPVDDVQSDPRFKGVANIGSTGNEVTGYADSGLRRSSDMVDLIEVRDMRTGKVFVLAPYSKDRKVIYYDDDDLQNNNRPNIYPIIFNPDDECFWGVSDASILQPQAEELNEIRTMMMRHRRISIIKLLYKGNAIDKAQLENMVSSDVGVGVQIQGDLSDVEWREPAQIPESLFSSSAQVENDIRDTMGFSRNQAGSYQSDKSHNAPTAVEARIVQAAASIRLDERRDILADVLVKVFEDTNELIFNKWDDTQVVQVMGPEAVPLWVAFKPEMLKAAEYEINIEPDSALPETQDMKRSLAMQAYGILKDNPLIDPQLLTSYLLRSLHGVQFDNMLKQVSQMNQAVQANAAQGLPGSTANNPMSMGQFMGAIASGPQKPPMGG